MIMRSGVAIVQKVARFYAMMIIVNFVSINHFQYKFSKIKAENLEAQKKVVMNDVATIIHEIEGDPKKPGAVYIHCYGGHHRTGIVWGVMQKCLGKVPIEDVIGEYKCHIGYQDEKHKGGFHPDNETLLREFPCETYFNSKS